VELVEGIVGADGEDQAAEIPVGCEPVVEVFTACPELELGQRETPCCCRESILEGLAAVGCTLVSAEEESAAEGEGRDGHGAD
jgi:hypothetical protein